MSKTMKKLRKNEHKKLLKLVSEQETLIMLLTDYYRRTTDMTVEVQEEMFPEDEPTPCENEDCDQLVYPINGFLIHHEYISENFDSLTVEDINLGLGPIDEVSEQSEMLLN